MSDDPEILDTIDAVFRLAASNALTERMGERTIEVRARAALALAIFMPMTRLNDACLLLWLPATFRNKFAASPPMQSASGRPKRRPKVKDFY